jgi:hypothetical protein
MLKRFIALSLYLCLSVYAYAQMDLQLYWASGSNYTSYGHCNTNWESSSTVNIRVQVWYNPPAAGSANYRIHAYFRSGGTDIEAVNYSGNQGTITSTNIIWHNFSCKEPNWLSPGQYQIKLYLEPIGFSDILLSNNTLICPGFFSENNVDNLTINTTNNAYAGSQTEVEFAFQNVSTGIGSSIHAFVYRDSGFNTLVNSCYCTNSSNYSWQNVYMSLYLSETTPGIRVYYVRSYVHSPNATSNYSPPTDPDLVMTTTFQINWVLPPVPSSPEIISVTNLGSSIRISWNPVSTYTNGQSMTPDGYKIYTSGAINSGFNLYISTYNTYVEIPYNDPEKFVRITTYKN